VDTERNRVNSSHVLASQETLPAQSPVSDGGRDQEESPQPPYQEPLQKLTQPTQEISKPIEQIEIREEPKIVAHYEQEE